MVVVSAARGYRTELQLTAEQKAAIAALHEAFMAENTDEIAALREIEQQTPRSCAVGRIPRGVGRRSWLRLHEILKPGDEFAALQDAIWAIYTAEQKAWIESHKPKVCDRNGPPQSDGRADRTDPRPQAGVHGSSRR